MAAATYAAPPRMTPLASGRGSRAPWKSLVAIIRKNRVPLGNAGRELLTVAGTRGFTVGGWACSPAEPSPRLAVAGCCGSCDGAQPNSPATEIEEKARRFMIGKACWTGELQR